MRKNENKASKPLKSASIAVKVMLVLLGVAILGLFAWLGVQIYAWIGGAV